MIPHSSLLLLRRAAGNLKWIPQEQSQKRIIQRGFENHSLEKTKKKTFKDPGDKKPQSERDRPRFTKTKSFILKIKAKIRFGIQGQSAR